MNDDGLEEAVLDLYGEPTIYNESMSVFEMGRR